MDAGSVASFERAGADGVVENYAIGGAVGAMFYVEAVSTEDVDAFVFLPEGTSGLLDLSTIYTALRAVGGVVEREYVRIGEVPLQILPDSNALIAEAIRDAQTVDFAEVPTRVMLVEHLCCIALQTGRAKDTLRVQSFLQQGKVDVARLRVLAQQYGLSRRLEAVESLS